MNKLPTACQIQNILEYVNLDEGFEEIAPEFLESDVNHELRFHLTQYKFHRQSIENILRDEYGRLIYEENYPDE